jgi:hypothetical protein
MKLEVSEPTYNELSILLKRQGRELNDGAPLSIEKGTAIIPPHDWRLVAVRQNCLIAAAEVFKETPATTSEKQTSFLKIADNIFKWCLSGEIVDKTEPFVEGVSNNPKQGWDKNNG